MASGGHGRPTRHRLPSKGPRYVTAETEFEPRLFRRPPPEPESQSIREYVTGDGRSALTTALVYGLSAAVPPIGAFALPAYTAYNYAKLGHDLFNVYKDLRASGHVRRGDATAAGDSVGSNLTGEAADSLASSITSAASSSGVFGGIELATKVKGSVLSAMFKGSISSALSGFGGNVLGFAIGVAVGR
jgi:hypothetical protein